MLGQLGRGALAHARVRILVPGAQTVGDLVLHLVPRTLWIAKEVQRRYRQMQVDVEVAFVVEMGGAVALDRHRGDRVANHRTAAWRVLELARDVRRGRRRLGAIENAVR